MLARPGCSRCSPSFSVTGLSKVYPSGFRALNDIDFDVRPGEIFALPRPNGAGKTTLINVIGCIATASAGRVLVAGDDSVTDYRAARSRIGLVPQELTTDAFETVRATVAFSRAAGPQSGVGSLLATLASAGLGLADLATQQSSLEEIFVDILREQT